ncbi:hypothetical protein BGX21_005095 [Mortierella sp. AD011]|nr:hypothetical protein BGX20_011204 [Mortierella sp. AD010]KAF9371532.1 hypothetical protein BGX21_005095 [Mortierella sp. AD011]
MADDASSNVDDAVIVVFQLEGLANEAHHCAVFTVKDVEFIVSCYRIKKKIRVEAVTSANAFGVFRQLSILDRENIIRSVNKIEESTHSVQAVVKAKVALCQDRYLFSILLQARTNEKCYDLKSRYTIPRNILTPVMLKPKLNHPTLFLGTAQGSYPTPIVSHLADDVFIVAIQLEGPKAKSHYRADIIIQNTRFTFCCYKKKVTVQVEVTTGANSTNSAFGMFRRYYILDSNNKVLSVRKFEESSNSLKVILKPDGEPEHPESLPVPTPILTPLPDSHTTEAPTCTSLELSQPTPPSSESDQQLIPISISSDSGCEAKADAAPTGTNLELPRSPPLSIENDQQLIPTLISPDSGCDAEASTAPTNANLELPRSPPLSSENDQESIPMSISSDLSYEPKADSPLDMVEDDPFDVHFFHCDQIRRVNVIGAHKKKILEAAPKLHLFVTKTEAARDVLAADMNFTSHNDPHFPSQAPVTVDISYLSLSAFRAVIVYIYTRSIETIFSNTSAISVTSSSVNAEYNSSQNGRTEVRDDLTVLYMDQVLYLAQRFDVTDLVEAFTRLMLFSTKIDGVIEILVQNADNAEFESIAMDLIKGHFHEIFGGYASYELFEKFRDRLLCHGLKSKIMGMMRTVEEAKVSSLDPPE